MFATSFSPIKIDLDRLVLERALACEDGSAGRMLMDAAANVLSVFNFPDFPDSEVIVRAVADALKQDPAAYLSAAVSKLSGGRVTLTECSREDCGVHILGWSLPLRLQRGNETQYLALAHGGFLTSRNSA